MSDGGERANYGIIGNVTAKAVAAGENAQANVTESGARVERADFEEALRTLREQVEALQLPAVGREVVVSDLKKIEEAGATERPNENPVASTLLNGLIDKLKLAGVALNTAVALQEPIRKLAMWFRVPLPF